MSLTRGPLRKRNLKHVKCGNLQEASDKSSARRYPKVLGTSRRGVRYRASGLNLLRSAVVLWNTVYMEREVSVCALREYGQTVDETLRQYLSPLGWEHINLMGERSQAQAGQISALRPFAGA
ncbi:MAG: Tn3 family transposase [Leptospirillum sp.]